MHFVEWDQIACYSSALSAQTDGSRVFSPPYTKKIVDSKPEMLDASPKDLQIAPTDLNSWTEHNVWTMTIIQKVKNRPASICNAAMKYKISEKQETCTMTIGMSVMALAIANAVGR